MKIRLAALIALSLAITALTGGSASASSGAFTKAEAQPDWSTGSFAGSYTWTDCNAGCKSWLVLIYAEPTVYRCEAEDWLHESDPNIRQVYNSLGQTGNKTVPFEVNNASLIKGVYGQRLCMIGVQSTETMFGTQVSNQVIGQTIFSVVTPVVPAPVPPAITPPTTKPTVSGACREARRKVMRLNSQRTAAKESG